MRGAGVTSKVKGGGGEGPRIDSVGELPSTLGVHRNVREPKSQGPENPGNSPGAPILLKGESRMAAVQIDPLRVPLLLHPGALGL